MRSLTRLLLTIAGLFGVITGSAAYGPAGTPDDWPPPMASPAANYLVLIDQLESGSGAAGGDYRWDAQAWYGSDRRRLWLKTEGAGSLADAPEDSEVQLLASRLIAPFWDWQVGIRHEFRPQPERTHLVFGVQGLAPYRFEWDSALFVSHKGDVSFRVQTAYDLRLTQRVILQPRLEVNLGLSDDRRTGQGSGVRNTELGLRLRYHLSREVAPYLGVNWIQHYAETKKFNGSRDGGARVAFVLGLRLWF